MTVGVLDRLCPACGGNEWYIYEYSTSCRTCVRARQTRLRDQDPYLARAKQRHQRYGLSPEDQAATLAAQNNRCALCGEQFPERTKLIHIDHDHQTGRFRGWLCHWCNTALGHYEKLESRVGLRRVEEYLR